MKRSIALFFILFGLFGSAVSQNVNCGFQDLTEIRGEDYDFAIAAASRAKTVGGGRMVPVVVHIIASSATSQGNIDNTQVQNGIDVLNAAFSGSYGGVDTKIQFCLAATNRVFEPIHSTVALGINDVYVRSLSFEDPHSFYNVWIVEELANSSGRVISGWTQYPKFLGTTPDMDGTIIPNRYWGNIGTGDDEAYYDEGKTAVHEAGHWLNLYHVFQGGCDYDWNCGAEGDCCCDTPPMSDTLYKCRERFNTCHTDNPDERDPVHNYMGYVIHKCLTEFTACQSSRMNQCLDQIRPTAWVTEGSDCPPPRWGHLNGSETRNFSIDAFPNPSRETVTIRLTVLGKETPFNVEIYDAQGKPVASLATSSVLPVGQHEYKFDAPAPGIYLARVASPWATKTIKLVSLAK